ncbi:hypothetical protein N8569_00515, partial [bacterium]|nr:hypothetical protein [bacterium]
IFVIFGILLYLFLNTVDGFSVGVPNHEHRNDRQLGTMPSEHEPAPIEPLDKGDIVKLKNNIEEHNLVENDHGVITNNIGDLDYEVQIFRPIREITTNLEDVRRRLILSYATQNHRLLSNSPLNIIPQDLLSLIIDHFNYYERRIGIFRIPQINLRLDLSPINILRDTLNPTTKYSCMSNGRCIENINHGDYNSKVECEIDCLQRLECASSMRFA